MPAQQKAGSSRCAGETPGRPVVAALCHFRILQRAKGPRASPSWGNGRWALASNQPHTKQRGCSLEERPRCFVSAFRSKSDNAEASEAAQSPEGRTTVLAPQERRLFSPSQCFSPGNLRRERFLIGKTIASARRQKSGGPFTGRLRTMPAKAPSLRTGGNGPRTLRRLTDPQSGREKKPLPLAALLPRTGPCPRALPPKPFREPCRCAAP